MTGSTENPWPAIVEDARLYPSPHNSQPIKLRPLDANRAILYYDLRLGLPAESFGIPFGHVCAGVFLETLAVVARVSGFTVTETLTLDEMDFTGTEELHQFAEVELVPVDPSSLSDPDAERVEARAALDRLRSRRTSRRPYSRRTVPAEVLQKVGAICTRAGHDFRATDDRALVKRIVHVNQATLFSDLENDDVYDEIMTWLRFSPREAAERADGLSAEAMLMPGPLLRFAMRHRGLWRMPVIGAAIRAIYLNTMRGVHQLGWIEGPFAGPAEYIEAGRTFMKLWLELHRHGVVLHPFGTVITNPHSHASFAEAVAADESGTRMAWMLFRFGYSAYPPLAHRRTSETMLLEPALEPDPAHDADPETNAEESRTS